MITAKNPYGSATARHTWSVIPLPAPLACPGCYHPAVGSTWQWQLNPDDGATGIDPSAPADMYDIDAFNNDAAVVADLKSRRGTSTAARKVTCYFPAGTRENWRPDAEDLDPQLLGYSYFGFSDERWIDVRAISRLRPWLEARMDLCRQKGFDAIEFDNVDGWNPANRTGLNITPEDEVAFIVYLANAAHSRGLSMAHKSNVEQIPQVRSYVDFAVVEECFAYRECTRNDINTGGAYGYDMLTAIGKAVFNTEYKAYNPADNACSRSNSLRFSTIYKHVALDSYRVACWDRSRFP